MARAINIIDLYDQANESVTNTDLKIKRMLIIYGENDSGGLLLDYHHMENPFYRLMFAAFEHHNRKKGLLTSCLEFAKNENINIPIVEIDIDTYLDMWKKYGYENPTVLTRGNFITVVSNVDLETLGK